MSRVANLVNKYARSIAKHKARFELRKQVLFQGVPPVLWSKGYASAAEQNGGLSEFLGRTEKRWTLEKFLGLYGSGAKSYWIPLTSGAKRGESGPIDWFAEYIAPFNKIPYSLITTDGDAEVSCSLRSETIDKILSNGNLRVWYTQNLTDMDLDERVKGVPIGLDLHSPSSAGVGWQKYLELRAICQQDATRNRRVFVDSCLNINSTSRKEVCELIKSQEEFFVLDRKISQEELWRAYKNFRFVLSPEGNGPDCHRTWEALYLGATVVCKNVGLGHLYEGLPVYQVESWSEINEPGFLDSVEEFSSEMGSLWDKPVQLWIKDVY